MGYIIKEYAPLLNTKITDSARKKISEGNFNISYFQIGDSEVCYDCVIDEDIELNMIIEAEYSSSNNSPNLSNLSNIKYPFYVDGLSGNTYGIPVQNSYTDSVYNSPENRGFFDVTNNSVITDNELTLNPNKTSSLNNFNGSNTFTISEDIIDGSATETPKIGDFVTIYFNEDSQVAPINNNYPVLTYKVVNVNGDTITVDRNLPDLNGMGFSGNVRVIFYPGDVNEIYDTLTPEDFWNGNAVNFECNGDTNGRFVKIWNMNIPWTENPAGLSDTYNNFGSSEYAGTKEYLGYNTNIGQTDTDGTYFYDSTSKRVNVLPEDQKSIAIVHYTNNSIDNFYGEKFALNPYDVGNDGETGQARNFKITLPWIMWHKSSDTTMGETFYVDPPNFDGLNLFKVNYIETTGSNGQQNSKLRYYHLWDTNPNSNGYPNRVGKVWPDLKIVTFDDDEIIAVLSNKSNRSWTLPAPNVGLTTPESSIIGGGLLLDETETLWVTYRFDNVSYFTDSLHCNYYVKVVGLTEDCNADSSDVSIKFGQEFGFLLNNLSENYPDGFIGEKISILAQKTQTGVRPSPTEWRKIDVTSQVSNSGLITPTEILNSNIVVTKNMYDNAPTYNLTNNINIPTNNVSNNLNFGDEYYFYGTIETDAEATIYVMNYLCNLGSTQFLNSSNPTWDESKTPRVTEIGLYDDEKNLMFITKVQSPEKRLGVQQYSIKLDF